MVLIQENLEILYTQVHLQILEKKLIILTPDTDVDELGNTQTHEYGHNCRLNHVSEDNLMADENHATNDEISTSIDEVDEGSLYTLPATDDVNQVYEFQHFDGWP